MDIGTIITIIVIIIIIIIIIILALAMIKPDTFVVMRSLKMKTTPDKPFGLVNDFKQWKVWSPYERLDPDMKSDYSGSMSGVGAKYAWSGSGKVGIGAMEITESTPPSKIELNLNFSKPMEASNKTEFTFVPEGEYTNVTWKMWGPSNFMSKVMQVFMQMDSLVGGDFEKGLQNMKGIVEGTL